MINLDQRVIRSRSAHSRLRRHAVDGIAPVYLADFQRGILSNGKPAVLRNTAKTVVDGSGNLADVASNIAALDQSDGQRSWLLESAATNLVQNSDMTGFVTGTSWQVEGNMVVSGGVNQGITTEVVGHGVTSGLGYVDIRVSGVATSNRWPRVAHDQPIPVGAAVPLAVSGWVQRLSGSGGQLRLAVSYDDSAGDYHSVRSSPIETPNFERAAVSWETPAGAAFAAFVGFQVYVSAGEAIDTVIRVGGLQVEAGTGPTSYIPTNGATVTRDRDLVQPLDLTGMDLSQGFSLVVRGQLDAIDGEWDRIAAVTPSAALDVSLHYRASDGRLIVRAGAGDRAEVQLIYTLGDVFELAVSVSPDGNFVIANGVTDEAGTSSYLAPNELIFGQQNAAGSTKPRALRLLQSALFPAALDAVQIQEVFDRWR